MPNFAEVLDEIKNNGVPWDNVRKKYLKQLCEKTGRNVIAYYSGWLQFPMSATCSISDIDKNGFMNTVHKLDRTKGLDLILHTPGGDIAATEALGDYLHEMFGKDIRCIIPHLAMSAGTMMACACKEIIMGKQSNIGPIDPQFRGVPAHGVLAEFGEAIEAVKNDPSAAMIWRVIIAKYHPTLIGECRNAIELASVIVEKWLIDGMFADDPESEEKARNIAKKLNNHADTKMHARHISAKNAASFGLIIKPLEEDDALQDLVLTIHHAYMHTFSAGPYAKIIENHLGESFCLKNRFKSQPDFKTET